MWELTVILTPIAVRRPPRGVKRATVMCRVCGQALDVRVHSATNTRVTKLLLLLLGIAGAVAAVVLFPLGITTDAFHADDGWKIVGSAVLSFSLALGGFMGFVVFDGARLRRPGTEHRLTYPARRPTH